MDGTQEAERRIANTARARLLACDIGCAMNDLWTLVRRVRRGLTSNFFRCANRDAVRQCLR